MSRETTITLILHGVNCIEAQKEAEIGVAQWARALRTVEGLMQSQLAELAGTNQAVIQKIETGNLSGRAVSQLWQRHLGLTRLGSPGESRMLCVILSE